MSTAMNKVTVTRLKDGTTYTAQIVCSIGDLIQYFDATTVSPDWSVANNHPVLVFHAVSSLGTGDINLANMTLYYDGVKITSSNNGGRFSVQKSSTDNLWRCTILKNLISPGPTSGSTNAAHTIRMVGQTDQGNNIQAVITVSCAPLTDSGRRAVIVAGDTNCFTVDQSKGTSCVLKALFNDKGQLSGIPSGYACQWFRQDATATSGWTLISGANGTTLTVSASDVETMQVYRVRIYNTTSGSAEEYYDTQSVMDVGDPFYLHIDVCEGGTNTTASATFGQTEPTTAYRTMRPSIINRSSGAKVSGASFYWSIMKPDGTYANASQTVVGGKTIPARTTAQATLDFPAALIDDPINGGQLDVICEGVFTL